MAFIFNPLILNWKCLEMRYEKSGNNFKHIHSRLNVVYPPCCMREPIVNQRLLSMLKLFFNNCESTLHG